MVMEFVFSYICLSKNAFQRRTFYRLMQHARKCHALTKLPCVSTYAYLSLVSISCVYIKYSAFPIRWPMVGGLFDQYWFVTYAWHSIHDITSTCSLARFGCYCVNKPTKYSWEIVIICSTCPLYSSPLKDHITFLKMYPCMWRAILAT